jgi:hypothetical protein
MASDSPSSHPLDSLTPPQRALLRIVCWVAWADGDFAEDERELLQKLVARLLPSEPSPELAVAALAAEAQQPVELERLVSQLEGADQRQFAVKLALQMVSINRRSQDQSDINSEERGAYRLLVEALGLSEAEVKEAEWAARQELNRPRTLLELLSETLGGFGSWPSLEGSQLPLGYWL